MTLSPVDRNKLSDSKKQKAGLIKVALWMAITDRETVKEFTKHLPETKRIKQELKGNK